VVWRWQVLHAARSVGKAGEGVGGGRWPARGAAPTCLSGCAELGTSKLAVLPLSWHEESSEGEISAAQSTTRSLQLSPQRHLWSKKTLC